MSRVINFIVAVGFTWVIVSLVTAPASSAAVSLGWAFAFICFSYLAYGAGNHQFGKWIDVIKAKITSTPPQAQDQKQDPQ